jgi:integrase
VHRVPLTDRVVALLEEARGNAPKESPWVFAGIKGGLVALRAVKAGASACRWRELVGLPTVARSR